MNDRPAPRIWRHLAILLGAAGLVYGAVFAINAAADTYADFYFLTGWRRPHTRSLDNYSDVKFKSRLVREAGRDGLDAAIFGSSRVMRIDPADPVFAALAPRAMNLGLQGAHLGQVMDFIDFVLRRDPGCLPVVGLDFFAFDEGPAGHSIHLDEAHPLAGWREAFLRMASDRALSVSWDTLRGLPGSNRMLANGLAIRVRPDPSRVRSQLDEFAAKGWRQDAFFRTFHYDPRKIELLRAVLARSPRTVFFVNPPSRWYRSGQEQAGLEPAYLRWLHDLGELGRVLDFSETREITDDPGRYYDTHHYDGEAGAMILADVVAFLQGAPLRHGRVLDSSTPKS